MTVHQLLMPNAVLYGPSSFEQVGEQARKLGKKALIVSDPVMDRIGNIASCARYLEQAGVGSAVYADVATEPTDIHVGEALARCRDAQCDIVVAIGGGSCIDTAKAVAALMTNGGHIRDYCGNAKAFAEKPLPLVAIPTTAGTGSEVTKVTVIIDTATEIKMMIAQPALLPAVAIVDPLLTLSCPPQVTAATGIDALCHAIEAYLSVRSQPVTDLYAMQAIELIAAHLARVYAHGDDAVGRAQLALASMLAGAAFSNASVTLVHGMSRPIGALFHVPHGMSNAMLLPAVLEFTRDRAVSQLARIGVAFDPDTAGMTESEQADTSIREIKRLCGRLGIPNMKQWGIDSRVFEQQLDKMATDALASGSPANNPKPPTHAEIVALYRECYEYSFERGAD